MATMLSLRISYRERRLAKKPSRLAGKSNKMLRKHLGEEASLLMVTFGLKSSERKWLLVRDLKVR